MLEIQNDRGQYLKLYPDSTLENELNSWLLSDDDTLPGSYSRAFKFPIVGNESFLQHKHRPEAGGFTGIPVYVAIDGLPFGAGSLNFRVTGGAADGYLLFDAGDVATKLRSKYIHDAVLEENFTLCGLHTDLPAAMARTLDPLTNPYPFVFFPIKNEDFCDPDFEATEYRHKHYINNWGNLLTSGFAPDTINTIGSPVVPFFYFTWVIRKICAYLGYTPEGSWLDQPDIRALVLYNEIAINCSGLWGSFTVNAKYHVWQLKINEFFKLLRDDMGVAVYFDATRGTISFYPFVAIKAAEISYDLSEALLEGYNADPVDQSGFELKFARDTGDAYQKELPVLDNYIIGYGEKSVTFTLGTLPMTAEKPYSLLSDLAEALGVNSSARWMLPIAKRRGISLDPGYKKMGIYDITFPPEATPPKLLSYFGMQPANGSGFTYPFGSSLNRNVKQEKVGPMSLMPDEPDSLFHTYVRPLYEFKAFSKKITLTFFLKQSLLSRLKLWQKIVVGSADMVELTYLISKITYSLPAIDGRIVAQATLHPILPPSPEYVPRIPSGSIWVRIDFIPFESAGYPDSAGTFTVRFSLFTTREAVTVAWSALPITLYYTYKTRGYDSNNDTYPTEEKFASIVVPANSTTVNIDTPQGFWKSDDPARQTGTADSFYILRSSFLLLPGGGYRII